MKPLTSSLMLVSALAFSSTPFLPAQTQAPTSFGFPITDAVQSFGFDTVDTLTGQMSLNIPLYSLPQRGPLKLSFSLRYMSYGSVGVSYCDDPYCNLYGGEPAAQPGVVPIFDQQVISSISYNQIYPAPAYVDGNVTPVYPNAYLVSNVTSFVSDLNGFHNTLPDASDASGTSARSLDGSGYLQLYNTNNLSQLNHDGANALDLNGITYSNPVLPLANGNFATTEIISDFYGDSITQQSSFSFNSSQIVSQSAFTDSNGNVIPDPTILNSAPGSFLGSQNSAMTNSTAGCPATPVSFQFEPLISSFSWTPPTGAGAGAGTYLFCYALMHVNNGLPLFNPIGFLSDDVLKLQSIVLPDKTAWLFSYNAADPSNPSSLGDGALNQVSLPTGGTVSYTYKQHVANISGNCTVAGSSSGISFELCPSELDSTVIASRTVNDGSGNLATWLYDIGTIEPDESGAGQGRYPQVSISTTHGPSVQQPNGTFAGNDVVDTYTSVPLPGVIGQSLQGVLSLTKQDIYQGPSTASSILESKTNGYVVSLASAVSASGATTPLVNLTVASTLPTSVSVSVPGVGTSIAKTSYGATFNGYNSYSTQLCNDPPACTSVAPAQFFDANNIIFVGRVNTAVPLGTKTAQSLTDFDASTVLVSTNTTPWWTTTGGTASPYYKANLLSLPASVVTSGPGNSSETDYAYDGNNGSPQGAYGNATTVSGVVNTGGPPLSKTMVYSAQGVPSQVTASGVVTQVESFQCNGRYPLSTTVGFGTPVAETKVQQRNCTTGAVTNSTDPNGILTRYSYNDPLSRLTQVDLAVNTSAEAHTKYVYASNQTTVTRDQTTKDDGLLQTIQVNDGLGRVTRLLQPGGVTVDVQYDAVGHKASESNPYYTKSDSTYDMTSYTYDALGRQLSATRASDGSATRVSFAQQNNTISGLKSVAADASGVMTTTYTDSTGRVSSVLDNLGNLTTYSYDGLSNLTGVSQTGSASLGEVSRVRTFKYDSLSRLLWANNPESGVICYGRGDGTISGCNTNGYDSNGNLQVKTDARGVIVKYSYDALNRLLSKQYSNDPTGTAASCYQYDASSVAGAGGGLIGNMTNSWTQALSSGAKCPSSPPSTGIVSLHSFLSYDPIGRLTAERECTAASCGHISYAPRYTYDLAGDTITHSSGVPSGIGNLVFKNSYDTAGRLFTVTSSNTVLPTTLFTATQATSARGCSQLNGSAYSPAGGLQNAILGTGLQLTRSYDPRLRVSCEADIGNAALIPASGTVEIKINGTDQTH